MDSPQRNLRISEYDHSGIECCIVTDNGKLPVMKLLCGDVKETGGSKKVDVDYTMISGKRRHCVNSYNEQKYLLTDGDTLTLRLYNDGLAWKKSGASIVEFVNPEHYWIQDFTDCYESFYNKDAGLKQNARYGYPFLVEFRDGCFGLLSESGVFSGEAGSSMYSLGGTSFELKPDGNENGGWQTLIIGRLNEIVESTLITDNSESRKFEDVSWIKPGVASWVYWAYNHGSNDYDIISRYVDLADELNLPYVLIDAEWDEMKNGKTVEDAVNYAHSKGVKPLIWYNSSIGWVDGAPGPKFRLNDSESLEREFAWCEKIGVSGVKIDFFSGDSNRNFKFMSELLDAAARHHLTVNFHGSPLPRGWQRTYPNFITAEAVYGEEWYNNVPTFTDKAARHNATLPFTRNVIGSMDYTPCAFSDSQHPHITSNAHELALTALYESGIQHIADRPESLLAQPSEVKDYLSSLPAAWDETVLLGGYPGEYVVMARRSGNKWWISGINGSDSDRNISIDYSRIPELTGKVKGRLFEDGMNEAGNEWNISDIGGLPTLLTLKPRGGFVIVAWKN